jgi:hypothetical protein
VYLVLLAIWTFLLALANAFALVFHLKKTWNKNSQIAKNTEYTVISLNKIKYIIRE